MTRPAIPAREEAHMRCPGVKNAHYCARPSATIPAMVRRAPRAAALVATMLLGALGLSPAPLEAATFQGTVVDGETAEPLEGALVIVIWWREGGHAAGHAQPIAYHVAEQITDVRGRFAADVSPGLLS